MDCQNCQQPIEPGAAFCGNCGQPVQPVSSSTAAGVPSYALTTPAQHVGETRALLSVIFGVVGILAALLIAVGGMIFGVIGIVMGTMSRKSTRRGLSTAGIILSSLALITGLAVWVYTILRMT